MHGFIYSIKENYSFSSKEFKELFLTSLTFAFITTAFFKGFLYKTVVLEETIGLFILLLVSIFASLFIHVSFQKIVGIKLGYKVTYGYWSNGLLISLFLSFITFGIIPLLSTVMLHGAVTLEHSTKLRLGKFRYGLNAKDIARVGVAGPLSHVLITMILGTIYLITQSDIIFTIIIVNLLLAIYSILPVPKIDSPTKMDSASDGLGIFFFSRSVYVFCLSVLLIYSLMIFLPYILGFEPLFSFTIAFFVAIASTAIYSITNNQKN